MVPHIHYIIYDINYVLSSSSKYFTFEDAHHFVMNGSFPELDGVSIVISVIRNIADGL